MKKEAKMIFISTALVILFGMASHAVISDRTTSASATAMSGSFACTMDAKVCADGTYVGRIPPYCQFAACPGEGGS